MNTRIAVSKRTCLVAGAFALVLGGFGSLNGYAMNAAPYAGDNSSASIPPTIDPFSRDYVQFPAGSNESAGVSGHSYFCQQHYNQPGCQTVDATQKRFSRSNQYSQNSRRDERAPMTPDTGISSTE